MADYQIGDNLYADAQGKYYRLNNGQKAFEESPYDTMSNKINSLYDSQRKNQLDQLKAQRDRAISGFNKQKTDLRPVYQNQRNQADVVSAQNASRLRELMAAQGINASGENLTTQASMASARQTALGAINTEENQAVGAIDQQIAEENDPAREQAIINAIESERSGKLTDAYQQSQQEIYQRYQDWRNYQMQKQQFELEQKMKELEYQRALAAQAAASSGGGGGGGRGGRSSRSSSRKTSSSSSSSKVAAAKSPVANQSALDRYYSSPAIQSVEALKARTKNNLLSRVFNEPVSPAQNPNLSAWAKMRMFGK